MPSSSLLHLDAQSPDIARKIHFTSSERPVRILVAEQPDAASSQDHFLAMTYNRNWLPGIGWLRDDTADEAATFVFEHQFNGSVELNCDIITTTGTERRPLTFAAQYDGALAELIVGGLPYVTGAGGVRLRGGTGTGTGAGTASWLTVMQRAGYSTEDALFEIQRPNGTAEVSWRSGGDPRIHFVLNNLDDARSFGGSTAIMHFFGIPAGGPSLPILLFEQIGDSTNLIQSLPVPGDSNPRFQLSGSGAASWGSGSSPLAFTMQFVGEGLKIGTERTQKLGFFGATPVSQRPSHGALVAGSGFGSRERSMLNDVYSGLRALGLLA